MDSESSPKKRPRRPKKTKAIVESDDWKSSTEELKYLSDDGNNLKAIVREISPKHFRQRFRKSKTNVEVHASAVAEDDPGTQNLTDKEYVRSKLLRGFLLSSSIIKDDNE